MPRPIPHSARRPRGTSTVAGGASASLAGAVVPNVDGVIAQDARAEIPVTWDSLLSDEQYGAAFVQRIIDKVCMLSLGVTLDVATQEALSPMLEEYLAKSVAYRVGRAGLDFWRRAPLSLSATGRNENKIFMDRAKDLRLDLDRLLAEIDALKPLVVEDIVSPGTPVGTTPTVQDQGSDFGLSPNPYDLEPPYGPPASSTTGATGTAGG